MACKSLTESHDEYQRRQVQLAGCSVPRRDVWNLHYCTDVDSRSRERGFRGIRQITVGLEGANAQPVAVDSLQFRSGRS